MGIRAYDENYISISQDILGHAVDYAISSLKLDPDEFGKAFAVSGSSKQFASGNPKYVAGMTGCELAKRVLSETSFPFKDTEDVMYTDRSAEYWAGWALAFYQWFSSRSFFSILSVVPISRIIMMYPAYHEMDISHFAEDVEGLLIQSEPATNLKSRRRDCGLSQTELAKGSGVALRQIQLFEQRQRDINSTAAKTLLRLSRYLNCNIENLMERP